MRIVHTFTTGKLAFPLRRFVRPDGGLRFMTGSHNGYESLRDLEYEGFGRDIQEGPNVIVEAAFKPEKDWLVDPTTLFRYFSVETAAAHALVVALADGTLRLENGLVKGFFTFKRCRRAAGIALIPHSGRLPLARLPTAKAKAPPADEAQGVPDLSDFIKTLGR